VERFFESLFIDESQDLAPFDLELVERLLKSRTGGVIVGDHREATPGAGPIRPARSSTKFQALAPCSPPPWSPASLIQRPFDRAKISRRGSVSCRSGTPVGARKSSAVSASDIPNMARCCPALGGPFGDQQSTQFVTLLT
jgi:hypothetical protein